MSNSTQKLHAPFAMKGGTNIYRHSIQTGITKNKCYFATVVFTGMNECFCMVDDDAKEPCPQINGIKCIILKMFHKFITVN